MVIGIDIGGHLSKAGLVQNEKIINKIHEPTNIKNEKDLFNTIFRLIDNVLKNTNIKATDLDGIGIGIAGMVLAEKGILLSAVNLGLENIDIVKKVQNRYKVPIKLGNDVSCFALSQSKTTGIDNLVYIALGTGINAGVINNGRLFSGANGASIEYGHTLLQSVENSLFQTQCSCGFTGCVECFISGKAMTSAAKSANIDANRPEDVFEQYNSNQDAKNIVDIFLSNLSIMLLNISNTYRPQCIFIGGGLANSITPFIKLLNNNLKQKNYGYKNAPPVKVEISAISTDGGILGAAYLSES